MMWGTSAATAVVAVASVAGLGMQSASAATTVTKYATGTTNVRSGAGTAYARVGTIGAGTKVTGALQANGWIRIAAPATYAGRYVSGAVLTSTAPAPVVVTMPSAGTVTGYVASNDHPVNIRSGPGFQFPVVGSYAQSTSTRATRVVGTAQGDWIKTNAGYVNKGVLVPNANPFAVNARIPETQLCRVPLAYNSPTVFEPKYDAKKERHLNCQALSGLTALENAYKAAKGHYALIDLAYRDAAEQQYWWDLWVARKGNPASRVGTSPHGWGLAVDFMEASGSTEFTYGGSGFAWLKANASKYGFTPNPGTVAGESYHWNFSG